jgi:AraC-like DNA-binding protein
MLRKNDIQIILSSINASLQELGRQKELSDKSRKKLSGILGDIDELSSLMNIPPGREASGSLASDTVPGEVGYTSSLDKEFLDKAVNVIENELSDPAFSTNEFCRAIGMSRTSVYNKIKTLTGQGPNDFIRIIRLKKARELLLLRKHTVAEVAIIVGFSDAKYFSTSFKKQFGVSPSKIKG